MSRFPRPAVAGLLLAASLVPAAPAAGAGKVTKLTELEVRGQISARGAVVALTQVHGDASTLWVGKSGKLPKPVTIARAIPDWGQPHVGTSAKRRPVVIYPSCTDRAVVATCDLRVYDVLSNTDAEVSGVNTPGVGETEGSMDRGAIAFTRWTAAQDPSPLGEGGFGAETTTLAYRAFGATARILTTNGGQQINLNRGRVAQVRDTESTYGICGRPAVEVVRVDGHATKTLVTHGCGLEAQTIVSPTFIGDDVLWGFRTYSGGKIERADAHGGKVSTATVKGGFATVSPTARTGAKLITGDYITDPDSPEAADTKWALKQVVSLDFS